MKFSIGELVRWYEVYDDVSIVKSSGLGVVSKIRTYSNEQDTINYYTVFTAKDKKEMLFEEIYLEKIK